jgi:hypothetical protein
MTYEQLRSRCSGFSPEPTLVVRPATLGLGFGPGRQSVWHDLRCGIGDFGSVYQFKHVGVGWVLTPLYAVPQG